MRPVMKSNPWPRRLQHIPMAGMLILVAVLSTKPITLTGLAIALCTVPFLCLAVVAVSYRWSRRFSGSKFMNIVAIILMITVATAVHTVSNYLNSSLYISKASVPSSERRRGSARTRC